VAAVFVARDGAGPQHPADAESDIDGEWLEKLRFRTIPRERSRFRPIPGMRGRRATEGIYSACGASHPGEAAPKAVTEATEGVTDTTPG
jgi:hypothetical protein